MSICKPQNINCYTDIYYLNMLWIGNYHKMILQFCIEEKCSFDGAQPRLSRIEPVIKEKSDIIAIRIHVY